MFDYKQFSNKKAKIILNTITLLLLVIGFFSLIQFTVKLGGIKEILLSNRSEKYSNMSDLGVNSYYVSIFKLAIFIYTYVLLKLTSSIKFKNIFIILTFIIYSFIGVITGSRLNIVILFLGILYLVYSINIDILKENKKKIIFSSIISIIFFIIWQSGRSVIPHYLNTGEINWSLLSKSDFSRSESVTGYIPGLIILKTGIFRYNSFYFFRIFSYFPTRITDIFGIQKPVSISLLLSELQFVRTGNAIYTLTLPIDIFISMGYIGIYIISFFLYLFVFKIIKKLA